MLKRGAVEKWVSISVLVLTTLVKSMQIGLKGAIEVTWLLTSMLRLEPSLYYLFFGFGYRP